MTTDFDTTLPFMKMHGLGNDFVVLDARARALPVTPALAVAVGARRQQATLRLQPGYDHSYFFIATFMEEHVAFHADALYS